MKLRHFPNTLQMKAQTYPVIERFVDVARADLMIMSLVCDAVLFYTQFSCREWQKHGFHNIAWILGNLSLNNYLDKQWMEVPVYYKNDQ